MTARTPRRGTIVPLLAVCITALFGFIALAVDMGMLMIARTECQNAADAAALVGARTLDNRVPNGMTPDAYDNQKPQADTNARAAIQSNIFLNANFDTSRITSVTVGLYDYNTSSDRFVPDFTQTVKPSGKAWTAVKTTVNGDQPTYFARVFGINSMPMAASATAAHRPRDIAFIFDFSGSMRFGSETNWGRGMLNPDVMYPKYGPYSRYELQGGTGYNKANPNGSVTDGTPGNRPHPLHQRAAWINPTSGERLAPNNYSITTQGGPAILKDFYYDPANPTGAPNPANLQPAFHRFNVGESGGNPTTYTAPTYNFSGYPLANVASGAAGATPAPNTWDVQSDSDHTYLGDKYPRKRGAVSTGTWDPTDSAGATITLAEYLGWTIAYSGGSTLPALTYPTGRSAINLRDATWERYGYDLDVAHYIANRNGGTTWDPRFDYGPLSAYYRLPGETASSPFAKDNDPNTPNPPTASTYAVQLATPNPVTGLRFHGYSMGPGYWGKTFFVWPPDPRDPVGNLGDAGYVAGDWRKRFFLRNDGAAYATNGADTAVDASTSATGNQNINQVLLQATTYTDTSSRVLRPALNQAANFRVNYPAVLAWIKRGPQVLPPNLRAGRVLYYSAIPDTVASAGSDLDQRFWREYIDYVLNFFGNRDFRASMSDFMAGVENLGWPEGVTPAVGAAELRGYTTGTVTDRRPYMTYTDNPNRPRMQMWFGPLSMASFIADCRGNMNSGTLHEAQCWQLKAGMNSALDDIRNNHPNDNVGICYFTRSNFFSIRSPMSQEWAYHKNVLFYPYSLIDSSLAARGALVTTPAEYRAINTSGNYPGTGVVPNANGGTGPNNGFMQAYNLLSSSSSVNSNAGRRGRRGAAKIIIFETDGVPNGYCNGSYQPLGPNSYYSGVSGDTLSSPADSGGNPPAGSVTGGIANRASHPTAMRAVYNVIDKIVLPVAASGDSGYTLPNAKVRVFSIGFGDLFDPTANPVPFQRSNAQNFLLAVQQLGNTSAMTDTNIPSYQLIGGDYNTRIDNLRSALERILQGGVQVTLIE